MPVVGRSGLVIKCTSCIVPAYGSKWVKLFGNDSPKNSKVIGDYVELGEVYAKADEISGECTPQNELLIFLKEHGKAVDLPEILPPDKELHEASCELTSDQALLLLEWIRRLRAKEGSVVLPKIPSKFIESIMCGKWLKTSSGFSSPMSCYLYNGTESSTLVEIGKTLNAISAIDEVYYMNKIRSFSDELIFIGVQFQKDDMHDLIVEQIRNREVSTNMSAQLVISLLQFIRYSNQNKKLDMELLRTLKNVRWLRTKKGCVTPLEAVYVASDTEEIVLQIADLCVVDNLYYENQLSEFVNELKLLGVITNMRDVYKLISENFKFPEDLSKLTKEAVSLSLQCICNSGPDDISMIEKMSRQPWIRTTLGYQYPSQSLLFGSYYGINKIVALPVILLTYYGGTIFVFKEELRKIGVAVTFDQACNMRIGKLKLLLSSDGLSSETLISILDFLKSAKTTMASELSPLVEFLSGEKLFKTCHGYNSSSNCILSDSKWNTVSQFTDLPFIDEAFYGSKILLYKDELKMLGVVVDFDEGAHILARDLDLSDNAKTIPTDSAKSFVRCSHSLRNSTKSSDQFLLEQLHEKLKGHKWLKTHMGYRSPGESLLMSNEWTTNLEETDGPFIDVGFYGTLSHLEIEELKCLGVKEDDFHVCSLMFQNLPLHDQTPAIMRVFRFLCKQKWSLSSEGECTSQLWVPDRLGPKGKWVKSTTCVLHDRDNLFGSFLNILDRHYDEELLLFISTNFGVDTVPTLSNYVDLWASWAMDNHSFSFRELSSFWRYISENWDSFTKKNLGEGINVVPATTVLGTVQLMARDEVFIPDDLQLKKAFSEVSESPIFVWFPQNGSTSLTRLYEIYKSLGVRKLSKSVQFSANCNFEKLVSNSSLFGKPLIKIVLAFLASPAVNMIVEERQWTSKSLLDIQVYGADNLIAECSLNFPVSNKILEAKLKKLVLWDKVSSRLLVHKPSWNCGENEYNLEFIFDFSQAISEVVLPNATDPTDDLCQIIKMGFACRFKEDEVDSLLRLENLEVSVSDNNYLECLFPSVTASSPASAKRPLSSPKTPLNTYHKKQR